MKTLILFITINFLTFFSICQKQETLHSFNSRFKGKVDFKNYNEQTLHPFISPSSGRVGFKDNMDHIIIPALYDSGGNYDDINLYIVTKKGGKKSSVERSGLFNNKGQLLIGFENKYELIGLSSYKFGYIKVIKKGKWGYINIKNEIKIPIAYDFLGDIDGSKIIAAKRNKYGLIDTLQNVIIDFKFDDLSNFSGPQSDNHRYAQVEIRNKYGFIDETGKIVIPCKYEFSYSFNNDFAVVKFNGKQGVINIKGETIIPFKYDNIMKDYDLKMIKASIEGESNIFYLYDFKGNFIKKTIIKSE